MAKYHILMEYALHIYNIEGRSESRLAQLLTPFAANWKVPNWTPNTVDQGI